MDIHSTYGYVYVTNYIGYASMSIVRVCMNINEYIHIRSITIKVRIIRYVRIIHNKLSSYMYSYVHYVSRRKLLRNI